MELPSLPAYQLQILTNTFAALATLAVGYSLAKVTQKICVHALGKRVSPMVKSFVKNISYAVVIILTLITALSTLGVPTASLVTVLGAASLAIALALRNFLANVAAGFMLVFLRPFAIDDVVDINGDAGTVVDINLFLTKLRTPSNEALLLPNEKVMNSRIINKTRNKVRRLEIIIGIDYEANIKLAKQVLGGIVAESTHILKDHEPVIAVSELADNAVNLVIRVWAVSYTHLTLPTIYSV